ncbi:MAG: MFS transporter [Pseudomonadota bacterium]
MNRILRIYADWLRGAGLSRVSKSQSPRELSTWAFASVAVAMTEGGFAGVVVKNAFVNHVSNDWLNAGVALAAAAPATANLMSFFWADFVAGRRKVPTIAVLLLAAAIGPLVIALVPLTTTGMFLFVGAMLTSRVFWAGALTVRSAVWRANNPDESRASFMGKVSVLGSASMAIAGAISGLMLDASTESFRWFYPAGGFALLAAGLVYRSVRVRRHRQLLAAERAERVRQRAGLKGAVELLRQDDNYRRYMLVMFFFGSGNLAYLTINVLLLAEQIELSRLMQMMITTTIPMAALPVSVPLWAHLFTRSNIARFRVGQGGLFVFGMLMTALGIVVDNVGFLALAAALSGTGLAAGNIGWHLGHNAFASDGRATDYMAVHVSLTGLRGLIAPLAAVAFYQWLVSDDLSHGVYALVFPIALMSSSVIGFARLSRQLPS